MFIRKKKNRSGSISVVVADKSSGKFTELKTIGVATSEEDIADLVVRGKDWIAHYNGQQIIDFERTDEHRKENESSNKALKFNILLVIVMYANRW